jgi:hypothetical protein
MRNKKYKKTPIELLWAPVKGFIAARNVNLNVNGVVKTAEEKFSSVRKEQWASRCMHLNKIEEGCLKLGPVVDEMSD